MAAQTAQILRCAALGGESERAFFAFVSRRLTARTLMTVNREEQGRVFRAVSKSLKVSPERGRNIDLPVSFSFSGEDWRRFRLGTGEGESETNLALQNNSYYLIGMSRIISVLSVA